VSSRPVMTPLKIMIFLAPLPFGFVGRVFSPLFYILLLIFSLLALGKTQQETQFRFQDKILLVFFLFCGFLLLQLIPLPLAILKLVSPATVNSLVQLREALPAFHPISTVPVDTLIFGAKFLVFALFFWTMIHVPMGKREIFSLLDVLILSAVLQVIFGLAKYLTGNRLFFLFFHRIESGDPLVKYLTGTLGNPNHFAFYLEMILPIALAVFFLKLQFLEFGKNLKEKFLMAMIENKIILAYLLAPLLLGIGIALTGSRAGIVTMILSFVVFSQFSFYLSLRRTIAKKLRLILIAITVAALLLGVRHTVDKFMSTNLESYGRLLRWPATIQMAADYPFFGSGFGTYRYAYFPYDRDEEGKWSTHAHNDYLEIAAEGGLTGGPLFLLLLFLPGLSFTRMWFARHHPQVKMIGLGVLVGLFAVACHSLFDFSLHIPANMFTFIVLLAIGFKIVTYKREFTA